VYSDQVREIAMNNRPSIWLLGFQIVFLMAAVSALYAQSMYYPPFFDDPELNVMVGFGGSHFNFQLRWLPLATLGWTINWLGEGMFWLRAGNVLLHMGNAIAVFFLLRKLFHIVLVDRGTDDQARASFGWFAFFGALLFSLHPVAVYGVGYLIQRSILMATLFVLLMLIAYLRGMMRGGWPWMVIAALCYFVAVYAKEHSIVSPAAALALTFLVRKPSLGLLKQVAPYYVLCALVAVSVIYTSNKIGFVATAYEPNATGIIDLSLKSRGVETPSDKHVYLLSVFTQAGLFFKYLGLWLIPNPAWMSIDMREPFAATFLEWPYFMGLIGFLLYPFVAVWLLVQQGKRGLLGLAMLFPWLLFLVELLTVRGQETFVLYRSYLWMPGLFVALPALCAGFAPKRAFLLLSVLAALLVPLSLNRLHSFSSSWTLWDDAEKLVHGKPPMFGMERIYYNRGHELAKLGRYEEAVGDFTTAIHIYPGYDAPYCDRATAEYMLGRYQAALDDYDRALTLNPKNPICYMGRGRAHSSLGNYEAAEADFASSCALGICR
jgi:hypothetical protein